MKQLIMFPGEMDGVFFKNEISYIAEQFDRIIVFTYPGNKERLQKIAENYNLEFYIVPSFSFYALIQMLWQFITDQVVKEERKKCKGKQYMYLAAYLLWQNAAERILRKECVLQNTDIYLYSFWLSRGAYTACRLKKRFNTIVKAVSRAHRYDLYEEENKYCYLPFREYIGSTMDEIYFISDDGYQYFKHKYTNISSKLCISRLGTKKSDYRKELKEKKVVCIASCSSMIAVKRIDLIIDTLALLNLPFYWIHLGDGELRQTLEQYARDKLQDGSYHFLGNVENNEIAKVYEQYDVDFFLNLSDSEGVPVSIMEAMSMGIPAAARDVGGNREIIDRENGLLLKKGHIAEQVQKIVEKRFKREEYQKLSDHAYQIWAERYYDEENYKKFAKLLVEKTGEEL